MLQALRVEIVIEETLYRALANTENLDLVNNTDDLACAIFLISGLKELGNNPEMIAGAFDANADRVKAFLSEAASLEFGVGTEKEKQHEID